MKIEEILKITRGKLLSGRRDTEIDLSKVSTDSRTIKPGEFFIALSGPNFCGSLFLGDAFKKGAVGAIVESVDALPKDASRVVIKVRDAAKALQDIASSHRAKFRIPVICVTGSNGKTTVKEMIAATLSTKYNVLKNEGTKNNNIGLSQTLLKLNKSHDLCVLELGTNHKGEIKTLSRIARPTVAVITNIGASHLEYFSDLKGVYREKRQILDLLDKGDIAVINGDDPLLKDVSSSRYKVLRYGLSKMNDFCSSTVSDSGLNVKFRVNGGNEYILNLLGQHNVYNALAAIAVASQFSISESASRKALANFKPVFMRLNPLTVRGILVINDAYNSNPSSMKAALDAMTAHPALDRWVVCGDMLELGREKTRLHRMVGGLIADSAPSGLLTFGRLSRYTQSGAIERGMGKKSLWHCRSHEDVADMLKALAHPGDIVLVKGSRSMKMEQVIEKLRT